VDILAGARAAIASVLNTTSIVSCAELGKPQGTPGANGILITLFRADGDQTGDFFSMYDAINDAVIARAVRVTLCETELIATSFRADGYAPTPAARPTAIPPTSTTKCTGNTYGDGTTCVATPVGFQDQTTATFVQMTEVIGALQAEVHRAERRMANLTIAMRACPCDRRTPDRR
jgi:hypothetical protein